MSEAKFTKGPWAASNGQLGPIEIHADGRKVAKIIDHNLAGKYEQEAKANSLLIAVAPEMYEEGAFKRNVIIHDNHGFDGEWIAIPREDFDRFQKARAKARGES